MNRIIIILLLSTAFSRSFAQISDPVKWSYAANKTRNGQAIIVVKAIIQNGWHIYSINQPEGGPAKTAFKFSPSKEFSLLGKVTEPNPISKYEKVFHVTVLYFEDAVIFQQKIKLKTRQTTIKGEFEFMACNDEKCLPPEKIKFSIPVK